MEGNFADNFNAANNWIDGQTGAQAGLFAVDSRLYDRISMVLLGNAATAFTVALMHADDDGSGSPGSFTQAGSAITVGTAVGGAVPRVLDIKIDELGEAIPGTPFKQWLRIDALSGTSDGCQLVLHPRRKDEATTRVPAAQVTEFPARLTV